MAFPAFLDTCVLFPAYLNDVLLTQAHAAAFRDLYPALVMGCLNRQVNRYSGRTGITEVAELLHALHGAGAERFADEARRHLR